MKYQLIAGKRKKYWVMVMVVCVLVFASFVGIQKSVNANDGTQFIKEDAGKFVAMGGRTWLVLDVIDGEPYLMMDEVYANRQWNNSGDSSNASEIFGFLESNFNNIITVAEDRDLIAETEWEIYSMKMGDFQKYTTAGGKTISPSSVTQKLGLLSMKDVNDYCKHFSFVLGGDFVWTRTPFYDGYNPNTKSVYTIASFGTGCTGTDHNPTVFNLSYI